MNEEIEVVLGGRTLVQSNLPHPVYLAGDPRLSRSWLCPSRSVASPSRRTVHVSTLYHHIPVPYPSFLSTRLPLQHFLPTSDMADQSQSSRLHWQTLYEAALHDYQNQTGISLADHPLAEQLQNCDSVESITAVLCEQTQAFNEFRGKDKVLKPFKRAVLILYKLSAVANFGQDLGLVCP